MKRQAARALFLVQFGGGREENYLRSRIGGGRKKRHLAATEHSISHRIFRKCPHRPDVATRCPERKLANIKTWSSSVSVRDDSSSCEASV